MNREEKSFELLLAQREQLVNDLATTTSVFHKTVLGFFTGLVTVIAAENFIGKQNESIIMLLIQMVIMLAIFVQALLISGNMKRYYIWAIDEHIYRNYGIGVLFYQGKISRKHTIGTKGLFPTITIGVTCITVALVIWVVVEFKFLGYIHNNVFYTGLVIAELILILVAMIYNFVKKFVEPQEYTDCAELLKRKGENESNCEDSVETKCNDIQNYLVVKK